MTITLALADAAIKASAEKEIFAAAAEKTGYLTLLYLMGLLYGCDCNDCYCCMCLHCIFNITIAIILISIKQLYQL